MLWIKFMLFVLGIFALNSGIQLGLRKALNLEKEKSTLSYNHVNGLHRKIDWGLRLVFLVLLLLTLNQVLSHDATPDLLLIVWMLQIGLDTGVRVFFEKTAGPEPKRAILTGSEGLFFISVLVMAIRFDWVHLFT
ncbi:DUF4181 domain-containing protein [Sporosarcina sp. FSL W7-1349]|uniref:DUF4181 domain-containing protein n=1 Tax=Sporosarcina sp. FSL W7-1349 TaxID=2921561 RepID=UPI0030F72FC7